jgi:16S rRNA (uracil1498-N3)-methyltransferase
MFTIEWERRQTQPRQSIKVKATHSGNAIIAFPEVFNRLCSCGCFLSLRRSMLECMTRRRWIADTCTETTATLKGEQAAHLARVLRAQPGQVFDVVANGFLHRAEILSADEREVVFALHEELETESALPVHLLMAVFKFDHMEWGIEKATELGVARITPVIARRTEKHLAQAAAKRVERWRRIVREAAQQSRRSDVPEVDDPVALKAALGMVRAERKLLLAETEQENSLRAALDGDVTSVALAIGPEGGWTAEEMMLFSESGWRHVTLGPRILRAETAAIAGLAVCAAML